MNIWKYSRNTLERPKTVSNHCGSGRPREETRHPVHLEPNWVAEQYKPFEDRKFIYDIVDLEGLMKSISSVAVCKDCGDELTCRTFVQSRACN